MKIALAVLLLTMTLQIFPSCGGLTGQDDKVVGYVEDRYSAPDRTGGPPQPWIVVNGRDYMVTWDFYREVHIGDLVKYENGRWTIIKKYVP